MLTVVYLFIKTGIIIKVKLYYGVFDNTLALRDNDFVYIASHGHAYLIELKKTVTDKLGETFNKCVDNTKDLKTPLAKEIASMGFKYSQAVCYELRKLHFMEKYCNCSLSYQLGLGGIDTCNTGCFNLIWESFEYFSSSECPLECDSVSFDLVKEPSKIVDGPYFIHILKVNLNKSEMFLNYTFDSIKEQIIFININFGKMSFTQFTEIPKKTFTDLISDLGGIIGNI